MLTDSQIKELLEWFVTSSQMYNTHMEKRRQAQEENHKWIQPQVIKAMSDAELVQRFTEYYRDGGGKQNLNQLNRDRIVRDKAKFRRTLEYLLNEDIPVKQRVDQILGGDYQIDGFGRAILTGLLMDFASDKYSILNGKSYQGFETIGWQLSNKGDSKGQVYLNFLKLLVKLHNLSASLSLDFNALDLFIHTIAAEPEGQAKVKQVCQKATAGPSPLTPSFDDDWAGKIADFIQSEMPPGRIAARVASETKASDLLKNKLGQFDENNVRQFFTAVNTEVTPTGKARGNRFAMAFIGNNVNLVIEQLRLFNNWLSRFWTESGNDLSKTLDEFWLTPLRGMPALPTLILYLRDPIQFNIWIDATSKGLKRITGYNPGSIRTAENYFKYNEEVIKLRNRYRLDPRAMDALLTDFGRLKAGEPPAPNYFWLNANPTKWDLSAMPVGGRETYTAVHEDGHWSERAGCFKDAKRGDIVVGYVTTPLKKVVALLSITEGLHKSDHGEVIEFEKTQKLEDPIPYNKLLEFPELRESEPVKSLQGSLLRLRPHEFAIIQRLIEGKVTASFERYGSKEAVADLFITEADFVQMLALLHKKKNVILQGPPGVGKSFMAKRLAYALIGKKDPSKIRMVQFHQTYSYEDFIQGYRPSPDGTFQLKTGIFYDFCMAAGRDADTAHLFIIDEINRGNLSKVFGELMLLIEADKRSPEYALALTYSKEGDDRFYIPPNIYLIGMMNTADRSLAMVDYALRRRFSFIDLEPKFASQKFSDCLSKMGVGKDLIDKIIEKMQYLNQQIAKDTSNLGKGYCIGHSFFCPEIKGDYGEGWYQEVIKFEIAPLIREYWFDKPEKVASTIDRLLK